MKLGTHSQDIEDLMKNVKFNQNYRVQADYNEEIAIKIIHSLDWEVREKVKSLKKRDMKYGRNPRLILDVLKKGFSSLLTTMYRKHRCQFKKTNLLDKYKKMILSNEIKDNKYLNILLMKRSV